MKLSNALRKLVFVSLLSLTGCGFFNDPYFQSGAVGGVVGTGAGAGIGALVGAAIANGDIAASALTGGVIGLPVGIIVGVAYQSYIEGKEIRENNETIQANYDYIMARQYEIQTRREELKDDSFRIVPDKNLRSYIFDGATIGAYNR